MTQVAVTRQAKHIPPRMRKFQAHPVFFARSSIRP